MADVWGFFANEDDYSDLDVDACAEHLSQAIRFKTVSSLDPSQVDWGEFDRLQEYLRAAYPTVFSAADVDLVGHSLLLTIPGSDESLRPAMLMAHQDVVPVIKGTEDNWTHPAFDGHMDDTYIWGRGTIDMKSQLVGELEAVEYVLSHGGTFGRSLILAFGEDEECAQKGSAALSALLAQRGVALEYVVDEGNYLIVDAGICGAPGVPFMTVDIAEKGYADIRLDVPGRGGHSSNPFGGTTLGILSQAISRIVESPYPASLSEVALETFDAIAPLVKGGSMSGLLAGGTQAVGEGPNVLAQACLANETLFPLVTTTIAPTMISGGSSATNVLPQDMWAVINFRLAIGTTQEDVLARCRELVSGLPVQVSLLDGGSDPSRISRIDGYGFAKVSEVAGRYFQDPATGGPVTLVPSCAVGATDAHSYESICDTCMRFSLFVVDYDESMHGVHGTNERITKRAFVQGVRAMISLVERTCVRP